MWAGDVGVLWRLAPCRCCCVDHTGPSCPARSWFGCLGSSGKGDGEDYEAWFRHYERSHGFTREKFDGVEEIEKT